MNTARRNPVRLGMQIAFGVFAGVFLRVRRKTAPTGPWGNYTYISVLNQR